MGIPISIGIDATFPLCPRTRPARRVPGMSASGFFIPPEKEQLVMLLAKGATIQACAKVYEVSERSVYSWLSGPEGEALRRVVRMMRVLNLEVMASKFADASPQAADVLAMHLAEEKPTDRFAAAKAIADYAYRQLEYDDIKRDLEEIKALLQAREGAPVAVAAQLRQLPAPDTGNGHAPPPDPPGANGANGTAGGNGHPHPPEGTP